MIVTIEKPSNNITVTKQAVLRVKILEFNVPSGIQNTIFTQKGSLLVGTGAGTYAEFPPGVDGEFLQFDSNETAGVKSAKPTLDVDDLGNKAFNGGFDLAQRQAPGTLTTISDGAYGPDRWKCYRENADLQYRRVDASGESGLTSPYYGEFKKITNAGKMLICQPLEYLDTLKFRGKDVSFQIKMKTNSAKTMRMAIAELQTGGTADTIPAVVSAWNVDATDPTLGTNLAVIGSPVSCSVTTGWQTFQFTGAFPTTSKNLLLLVWSNADVPVNDTLGVAEAGLHYGTQIISWSPRSLHREIELCRRYYFKSFPVDTAPAQNAGTTECPRFSAQKAGAVTNYIPDFQLTLRTATPTLTTYNPSAANAQARDVDAAADCSAISLSYSGVYLRGSLTGAAGTAVGNRLFLHFSADAEL